MSHKCIKVGVTGHRYGVNKFIYQNLFIYLEAYIIRHNIIIDIIISPLADGADRIVAIELMNYYNATLVVPLPYELDYYIETIKKDKQDEFYLLLQKASSVVELTSLSEKSKEYAYMKVGEYVVNHCDLLIVIWDGEPSKGVGGTADIVMYAKNKKKDIIYINSINGKIELWRK